MSNLMLVTERDVVTELIELYRNKPCLWDMASESYKNANMKAKAWQMLTQVMKKLDPEANVVTTKKKFEHLRTSYKREAKKVSNSRRAGGDEHIPKLWYYNLLSFVDKKHLQIKSEPPTEPSDEDSSDKSMTEEVEITIEPLSKSPNQIHIVNHQSHLKPLLEKVGHSNLTLSPSRHARPIDTDYNHQPSQPEPKPLDTSNTFAIYVGEKLNEIEDIFQRQVAEKLIADVIFQARTGQLRYDTKIESPNTRQVYSDHYMRPQTSSVDPLYNGLRGKSKTPPLCIPSSPTIVVEQPYKPSPQRCSKVAYSLNLPTKVSPFRPAQNKPQSAKRESSQPPASPPASASSLSPQHTQQSNSSAVSSEPAEEASVEPYGSLLKDLLTLPQTQYDESPSEKKKKIND